ncbi:MAG: HNH endonuclease signature motif containing protein [Candidatus Magasanikiibacteriota bacterium]
MPRDKNARKKYYQKLCERDGERCKLCGKEPPEVYLEVDHVDGNPNNNPPDMSNFQLLCRKDGRKKNPRGKGKGDVVKRRVISLESYNDITDLSRMSPEMAARKKYRSKFSHWLYKKIKENGPITVHEATFAGAKYVGCSSVTIRTSYLLEETSSEGMFQIFHDEEKGKNMVTFRNAASIGIDTDFEVINEKED